MASNSVSSVDKIFAAKTRMVRVQKRKTWRAVKLRIGHHLVDIAL